MSLRTNCRWLCIDFWQWGMLTYSLSLVMVERYIPLPIMQVSWKVLLEVLESTVTGILDDRAILFIYLINKTYLDPELN